MQNKQAATSLRPLSGTDYTRLIGIMEQHADLTHSPRDRHILRILKHNQPIQEQSDRNRLAEALTSGACCIDSKATLSPYI